jgi:replicative DNA helicase
MQQADRFLFSLVVGSGRRGRSFVLKQEHSRELVDKWLCLMADVDEKKVRLGLISSAEAERLRKASTTLHQLPIYVERNDDDFETP